MALYSAIGNSGTPAGTNSIVAKTRRLQRCASRDVFAMAPLPILLTCAPLLRSHVLKHSAMSAKERKRKAVADLRDLSADLGLPANRRQGDLAAAAFTAAHAQVVAACRTAEQRQRAAAALYPLPRPAPTRSGLRRN